MNRDRFQKVFTEKLNDKQKQIIIDCYFQKGFGDTQTYIKWSDLECLLADLFDVDKKIVHNKRGETDLSGKCGSCKYFDMRPETKKTIGYPCTHKEKRWMHESSRYRPRTTKKCRLYEVE